MNVLEHLKTLVGFDTCNPPRHIKADSTIFAYAQEVLQDAGFTTHVTDLGQGCVYLFASRGLPTVLINVHLDTVPADEAYSADPFTLRIDNGRAIGLGACDIKGAAAAALAAAQQTDGPAAILFSSDEEAGTSRCIRHFCAHLPPLLKSPDFRAVLVAEPTGATAVTGHRGIKTFTTHFQGQAGHSSGPTALEDNALHKAARWVTAAVELASQHRQSLTFQNLSGSCLNIGVIEGGKKPNIVAPTAHLRWGIRPLPGQNPASLAAEYQALASPDDATFTDGFTGPSLPATSGPDGLAREQKARHIADALGLPPGDPVDFWTEAALFSQAGLTALVFGPGHIDQAHTADEWVSLDSLHATTAHYRRIFSR